VSRSMVSRALRGSSLALLVTTAIALSGSGALAAHTVNSSGAPGSYAWTDTAAHPGGYCNYNGGGTLGHVYITYVRVNAPTHVFWPTGQTDTSGTVGLKVILQHQSGVTWNTVNTSSETYSMASTTSSASFGARRVAWNGPITGRDRAKVVLTWYDGSSSVIGRAQVVIDHYANGHDGNTRTYCPVVFTEV
jgi:hypothetical protein